MLQFWKRSSQKDKIGSGRSTTSTPPTSPCLVNGDVPITLNNFESGILAHLDDEGLCDISDTDAPPRNSRLSKSLCEVLGDKAALGYFVQYLDAHGGLPYVRCYLDVDSFRCAALQTDHEQTSEKLSLPPNIITRDQLENTDLRLLSPLPSSRIDHDSLSVSTDCDSYTADSASLYDYSEKSAIDKSRETSDKRDICDKDVSDISYRLHKLDLNKKKEKSRVLTDDSLRIFKKYIAQEAPNSIVCPEDLRNDIIESICTEDGIIDSSCYDKIQKYVFDIMEQKCFHGYIRSHYNCKYQIDVLTSGNIILQDILYNESILFYFMEFLEQEGCCTLLEFWLAAINFRQTNQNNYNPEEAQNDAIILYDKYFSLQATCPLGFGDKIRFVIEENICQEGGPQIDCFSQPIRIIENFLDKNYLKSFLSSQLYFKYLSELISTVQTNGYSQMSKSRHTNSDCSSEVSNTLLAMDETNIPKRKSLKPPKTDMNIDTRQLYDPDSLWKRRKTRRLSFGRITDLGRFETDVEPEPDKKTESRIARAMKRLVNMEETKTKEEMAWQVAEMIVKDITSVTLADAGQT